ncbi:hypothetical protein, partial [Caballeronia sp.]|uniref:hypothetical protein n=1 Tax=Caballeronia sp. TaxID=1931223 RepID=UPI003C34B69E
ICVARGVTTSEHFRLQRGIGKSGECDRLHFSAQKKQLAVVPVFVAKCGYLPLGRANFMG